MLFGVLFNISTWDLIKGVSVNVFWIFWYLPKLIPWPILLFFVAIMAFGILRKYLQWKTLAASRKQMRLSEETKMDLLRKIEENTRQKP